MKQDVSHNFLDVLRVRSSTHDTDANNVLKIVKFAAHQRLVPAVTPFQACHFWKIKAVSANARKARPQSSKMISVSASTVIQSAQVAKMAALATASPVPMAINNSSSEDNAYLIVQMEQHATSPLLGVLAVDKAAKNVT